MSTIAEDARRVRRYLGPRYPHVQPGHLASAVAYGFGYSSPAAMKMTVAMGDLVVFDQALFAAKLSAFGYRDLVPVDLTDVLAVDTE